MSVALGVRRGAGPALEMASVRLVHVGAHRREGPVVNLSGAELGVR
jgi:hypothetical protein